MSIGRSGGRNAAHAPAGSSKYPEASTDSCQRVQPKLGDAGADGGRKTARICRAAGEARWPVFLRFFGGPVILRSREGHFSLGFIGSLMISYYDLPGSDLRPCLHCSFQKTLLLPRAARPNHGSAQAARARDTAGLTPPQKSASLDSVAITRLAISSDRRRKISKPSPRSPSQAAKSR